MTVLCWNTIWISVHSSDYNFFNFLSPPSGIFNRGFKKKIIMSLIKPKFAQAANALCHVSVSNTNAFNLLLKVLRDMSKFIPEIVSLKASEWNCMPKQAHDHVVVT